MVLPIVAYGNPVLRKVGVDITSGYPGLKKLVEDMWETLYNSKGVGLAAPQIDKDIRLFIVDSVQVIENLDVDEKDLYPGDEGYKGVFINARIAETEGEEWPYNEGCLSIPKIREDIFRRERVTIHFLDENFVEHTKTFIGVTARIILHEYDHIEGKLFIDYLKPLKKSLLKRKLSDISKGKVSVDYKMAFNK
ncbi:peptide deformylase [Hanamia caeni]|jgi:peptide deformylase|uniref:Peptide deformylase n=1 Tax=Hanamia caeni TaxID=2294116 RepID=A0A3M9NS32_9BACT|nr:peptide deformylase [Hanamia caeni]RNI40077.1 peptide deformylase [Hanamia caeni]